MARAVAGETRTALASLEGVAGQGAMLWETGRAGQFVFYGDDMASEVAGDGSQGIFIPPSSDPTGASGAWVRQFNGSVDPRWFGVVGDGVTDDAPALQLALDYAMANGRGCHIPGGNYAIGSSLTLDTSGFSVTGEGWYKTRLIPTAAVPAVIVSGTFGSLRDIGIWGTSSGTGTGPGTYGLVMKNAGGGNFTGIHCRNLSADGVYLDPAYGGGAAGNNNLLKFHGGGCNSNAGCGYRMAQHGDNNGINFLGTEANGNSSHGMLLKSEGWYVAPSCIIEGNAGYGVQIGEDADGSSNTNGLYDEPWTEGNVLGDVRSSQSAGSNRIRFKSLSNSYSRHSSAVDVIEYISAGITRVASNDGDAFVQLSANTTSAFVMAASKAGGNVNLNLAAAGSGVIHAQDDIHLDTSKLYDGATGLQVLGARGAAVADASGGATVDAEARTAINTLLARLRTHGLIAS